ncbi:hypothetical protein GC194_00125 [bacterium]|nr:hypothetical protein [bacterium]
MPMVPTLDKEAFYNEQLLAQRAMLSNAIEALQEKRKNLEEAIKQLESRNFEMTTITYQLFHSVRGLMTTLMGIRDLMKNETQSDLGNKLLHSARDTLYKLDRFSVDLAEKVELLLTKVIFSFPAHPSNRASSEYPFYEIWHQDI